MRGFENKRTVAPAVPRRSRRAGRTNSLSRTTVAFFSIAALIFSTSTSVWATEYDVSTAAGLASAITSVNGGSGGDTIKLLNNITLSGELNAITQGVTINGNGQTLSGANAYRGLFIDAPSASAVSISNLTIANGLGQGGNGAAGGGGGMGAGGGIFAMSGAITLSNVTFSGNKAQGGNGGAATPGDTGMGGGGGLGGNGGAGSDFYAGGGGGIGLTATGGAGMGGVGSAGDVLIGAASGGSGGAGSGGANAGGGAGVASNGNGSAGGGGLGGSAGGSSNGGNGGFGGGGGGGGNSGSGTGGFGGGGGAGFTGTITGASGGFGGGGGSGQTAGGSAYGGGAGGGPQGAGGGGLGAGGAVFVCTAAMNADCGATLTISNTSNESIDGTAVAGTGANNGAALGGAIFLTSGEQLSISVGSSSTTTISGTIQGDGDSGLAVSGGGTLVLGGSGNSFNGLAVTGTGTFVSIGANNELGSGAVSLANGTGLDFTGTLSVSTGHPLTITGDPTFDVSSGDTVTYTDQITGAGDVEVTGGGTLVLANATNNYSLGTVVTQGSTVSISAMGDLGSGSVTLGDNVGQTGGTLAVTSSITLTTPIAVDWSGAIDVASGKTLIYSGVLSGGNGFTVTDSGILQLSNANNTYSGAVTINSGATLALTGSGNLTATNLTANGKFDISGASSNYSTASLAGASTGAVVLGNNTLTLTNAADNFAGVISGNGGVTVSGGTETFSGGNTFGGNLKINSGATVVVGIDSTFGVDDFPSASATGTGTIILNGGTLQAGGFNFDVLNDIQVTSLGGTIDANGHFINIINNISDSGAPGTLTIKSGASDAVLLEGDNTYSAATVVNSGSSLNADSATSLSPNSDFTVNGTLNVGSQTVTVKSLSGNGVVQNAQGGTGTLTIGPGVGETETFSGTVQDDGPGSGIPHLALVMAGSGTQIFTGNNDFVGGLTLDSGIFGVGSNSATGDGTVTFNGGTLQAEGSFSVNNTIQVNSTGGTIDSNGFNLSLGGNFQGAASSGTPLVFAGTGSTTLTGNTGGSYSGSVTINSGATLIQGSGAALLDTGTAVAGTLEVNGTGTIGALTGSGVVKDSGSGGTLDIDITSGSATFGGTLKDSGTGSDILAVQKDGAGSETLSGNNTYTGGTSIIDGTLVAGSSTALGNSSGAVALYAGATLDYANGVSIANGITLKGSAALNVAGTDVATQSGAIGDDGNGPYTLNKTGTGTLILSANNSAITDPILLTAGTLGVGASGALGSGTVTFNGGALAVESDATLGNTFIINSAGATFDANQHNLSVGAVTDGTGVTSATELTFASTGGPGTITLTGDGSGYSGSVTINSAATLIQGSSATLPAGAYAVNGKLEVVDATIAGLTGSGTVQDSGSSGTLDIDIASGSGSFSGTLQDSAHGTEALSVEKSGAGTQTLSGNNTYTGGTTINAGTLIAGSNTALGDSGGTVSLGNATLSYANGVNIANGITLTGAASLNVAGTDVATQSGAISDVDGTQSLTKTGTGTLKLTAAGTYSSPTTLAAGTVEIGNATALGSGMVNFDGGTLKVDGAYTLANDIQVMSGGTFDTNGFNTVLTGDVSSDISSGALSIIGTGSVKISGINNLSGDTDIDAGATLEVAGASGLGGGDVVMAAGSTIHFTTTSGSFTGDFELDGAAIFNIATGITDTLSGVISDGGSPGTLEKQGAGTLVLTNTNTYSGGTVLSAGTLEADNVAALGTGTLTLDGGTLTSDGSIALGNAVQLTTNGGTVQVDDNTITLNGVISDNAGGGVLHLTDSSMPGIVILGAANIYSQGTTIGSGVTAVAAMATSFGSGTITLDGGILTPESSTTLTIANAIQISNNGATILGNGTTLTLSGVISDEAGNTGALTVGSDGSADTSTVILSGNNSYSGGTTIAGGTVEAANSNAFGNSSGSVQLDAGTVIAYANGVSIANSVILAGTADFNVASGSATQSGAILDTGSHALTKTGGGTLILSGSVNYGGATNVNGGTLQLANASAAEASSDYTIASGAVLFLNASLNNVYIGSLAGSGTVTAGSGTDLNVGDLGGNSNNTTFSGAVTASYLAYDGAGTLTLSGNDSITELVVCACVTSGGITLSGGSMTSGTGFGVESGTLTIENGETANIGDLGISGGTALITGSGTSVTSSAGTEVVSTGTASASLTVSGGANLTTTGTASISAGGSSDGAASVTVTGTGTTWNVGTLDIGGASTGRIGSLTVANGASVTSSNPVTLSEGSTLNIGNGATAGSLSAPSISGGSSDQIVANFTGSSTLGALLTGGLSLTNQGSGTLILTAANNYTGTTTITAGTIQIGNGAAGATIGAGAITDNGTLAFKTSTPTTLANTITGSGGVSQMGSGALTIAAAKAYTGVTSIASGSSLLLTGAGDVSASSEVAANGTFDVSGVTASTVNITSLSGDGTVLIGGKTFTITNGTGIFSGDITDNGAGGSISVTGDEQLTGTNTFSGGLAVGAGTLVVTDPAALGTGPVSFKSDSVIKFTSGGTFTNNANFSLGAPVFDTAGSTVTWSGQLTGPGDLGVTGGGTLILTNATNNYAGGTEVYGGTTLRVDADGELGATASTLQLGDATTKGTLQFASAFTLSSARTITLLAGGGAIDTQTFNDSIGSVIGGAGSLTKLGTGTLTLSGASTYTGPTTISAGALSVTGSLASAVTVASGGTLNGTGSVGAATVASGGTVTPGVGGSGTLRVAALTLAGGSTTAIALTPAAATKITATGAATLGGTLALSPAAGTYANGTDFKLLSASSVSGTFASVTGAAGLNIASTVQYSATGVDLILGNSGTTFLFGSYGTTPNQIAAGNALAAGSSTGALYTALGKLVSSNTASVPGALGQLAGEIHASMRGAMIEDSRIIRDTVLARGDQDGDGVSLWASSFGDYGSLGGTTAASALHRNDAGVIAGADIGLMPGLRAGIAGAYTAQKVSIPGVLSSATGVTNHVVGYASWNDGAVLVNLGGDYGWGANQVRRQITALAENDTDHQSNRISQVFSNAGYRFTGDGGWMAEPYAGIAYVSANTGAFAETGGVGVLSGTSRSSNETYSTLGARASLGDLPLGSDISVTPRVDFAWQHAFNTLTPGQTLTFTGAGQSFAVLGVPLDTDMAAIQAGLDVKLAPALILSIGYDGNIGARDQDHAVRGILSFQF